MSPNAPLTDQQRNALVQVRAMYKSALSQPSPSTAESVDERARHPAPGSIPADVTVRVEIAPPSPQPHPLLDSTLLKKPERVPIYFYSLLPEPDSDSEAVRANTRVIFFIHGGGNVVGHPTHLPFVQFYTQLLRGIASRAGEAPARYVLIAPTYRLATVPENTFPAALQDLVAAYDYVLGKGYDASNVIIAGDSAGGNHAVVLTHLVLQSSRPSPRGVVAIAPSSLKVTSEDMSVDARAEADMDVLDRSTGENMARKYVGDTGVSFTDPLVSGALIPFTVSWPRTLILVGTADNLLHASRELEKRLSACHRPVELVEYNGRPHGWWVMPQIFPENVEDAVERIATFVLQ